MDVFSGKQKRGNDKIDLFELEYEAYLRQGCKFAGRCPQVMAVCKAETPADIQALLAEITADDGVMDAYKGAYAAEKAAALLAHRFDRVALGKRSQPYERLDQLTLELLMGVR